MNPLVANSGYLRPLHWRKLFSSVLKNRYAALVSSLFACGGPAAVFFGVAGIIVDPVNRVACRRGRPHIGKECLKAGSPIVAHEYPSPTVPRVIRAAWVMASFQHHRPGVVLLGLPPAVRVRGLTMPQVLDARHFLLEAAARLGVPRAKFVRPNEALVPACATTLPRHGRAPSCFVLDIFASAYDKQAPKLVTGKVNKNWHFFTLKRFTVRIAWQAAVNSFSGATLSKPTEFNRSAT